MKLNIKPSVPGLNVLTVESPESGLSQQDCFETSEHQQSSSLIYKSIQKSKRNSGENSPKSKMNTESLEQ